LQHPGPAAMPPLLMARLLFSYDGHRVSFPEKDPRVLVQGSGTPALIIRDEDAEIELLHRNLPEFRMAGVMTDDLDADMVNALPHSSFLDFTLPSRKDWLDFIAFDLPKLHADGWQIEMDESFDVPVIEIDQLHGSLQSDEESPGWFDVEVGIDYNGTRIDLIPLLQQALAYLDIENNSDDALPETLWLHNGDALIRVASDRIRPLARTLLSLLGKERNGKLTLPKLDAAQVVGVVEANWQTGAELRNLSEKLTSFQAPRS